MSQALEHRSFPLAQIAVIARRHHLREVSLFGSVLREDFGPESDVDVLIALQPGHFMTLESHLALRDEFSALFGNRHIDLVRLEYLRNPYRKKAILESREIVYGG